MESFKECHAHLQRVNVDAYDCKWALLALHNGMSALMVGALCPTNSWGVLSTKDQKAFLENRTAFPLKRRRIVEFRVMVERIQSPDYVGRLLNTRVVTLTENEKAALEELCDMRDRFTHFEAGWWIIALDDMPLIFQSLCSVCVKIIASGNLVVGVRSTSIVEAFNLVNEIDECASRMNHGLIL